MRVFLRGIFSIFLVLFCYSTAMADAVSSKALVQDLSITENTNPEIKALHEKLSELVNQYEKDTEDYKNALQENADAMKATEQSTENKLLGAAGIGATGIGGMMAVSALSEQSADAAAERDMQAYLETFRCTFGSGQAKGGDTGIPLPGGNALLPLYTEYQALAEKLKLRKQALELPAGIESEVILDKSTMGLYDDQSSDAINGTFASLSKALQNPSGQDAKELEEQKTKTSQNLKTGAITAGAGAALSAVGNMIINKDAPKENSEKIQREYEQKASELTNSINSTENELNNLVNANKEAVEKYNNALQKHKDLVEEIKESECVDDFKDYIEAIDKLEFIKDDLQSVPELPFDNIQMYMEYQQCLDMLEITKEIDEDFEKQLQEIGAEKYEIAQSTIAPVELMDVPCPTNNPKAPFLNNNRYYVGNSCAGGNITAGTVFKYDDATCGCKATACKTGFIVKNGVCEKQPEIQPTQQNTTTNQGLQKCPYAEFDPTDQNNTLDKCIDFCKQRAEKEKCEYYGATIRPKDKKCVCSSSLPNPNITIEYFEVCEKDKGRTGKKEICEKDFFKKTNVQMLQATDLAKEYVRLKYGQDITCSQDRRKSWNDDYIKCTSTDNSTYYEFRFDDVKESFDKDIQDSVHSAVCRMHGTQAGIGGFYGGGTNVSSVQVAVEPSCLNADKETCEKINVSLNKFGYSSEFSNNKCVVSFNTKRAKDDLHTAFGIDNFAFCAGIQLQGSENIKKQLETYTKNNASEKITSFRCNGSYTTYTGEGCNVNGITDYKDDVLTCYANGQQIDFIFDDLAESWNVTARGGEQGMSCIVSEGTYTGAQCIGLNQTQCENLSKQNLTECPECKTVYWDAALETCVLPSSKSATNLQKGIKIGTIAAGVVVGAVITVTTAGTGAAAVTTIVIAALETAGGTMVLGSEIAMTDEAQKWLTESQHCRDSKCAEKMIKEDMQRMANLSGHFETVEVMAIDSELARLIDLLPEDSEIVKYSLDQYHLGFFDADSWEPEQVIQAIGTALQLSGLFVSAFQGISKSLTATSKALQRKITATDKDLARAVAQLEKTTPGSAAATRQAAKVEKLAEDAKTLDRVAKGEATADDMARISADGNKTLRHSAARLTTPTKTADEIAADGAKLKRYDQLKAKSRLSTTEQQELQTIHNSWGNPSDEVLAQARVVQSNAAKVEELNQIQKQIDDFDAWAEKNPGAAKSLDKYRRKEIEDLRKKADDLRTQINGSSSSSASGATAGANTANQTDNMANTADDIANNASNVANNADNVTNSADDVANKADDIVDEADVSVVKSDGTSSPNSREPQTNSTRTNQTGTSVNAADDAAELINSIEQKLGTKISDLQEGHMISGAEYRNTWSQSERTLFLKELEKHDLTIEAFRQPNGSGGYIDGGNWFITKINNNGIRHLTPKKIPKLDEPITNIHGYDVFVETIPGSGGQKVGMVSGRPVVVVNVNGQRFPMYTSTGSAGKLDVPTGKWEFFAGIDNSSGKAGWFNKGTLEDISSHYNSPELKQIADALDAKIGDVRNVEDIVATASRKAYNGIGNVGYVDNLYDMNNSSGLDFINSGFSIRPGPNGPNSVAYQNTRNIKNYLSSLADT